MQIKLLSKNTFSFTKSNSLNHLLSQSSAPRRRLQKSRFAYIKRQSINHYQKIRETAIPFKTKFKSKLIVIGSQEKIEPAVRQQTASIQTSVFKFVRPCSSSRFNLKTPTKGPFTVKVPSSKIEKEAGKREAVLNIEGWNNSN